jgi:hypothetical protein
MIEQPHYIGLEEARQLLAQMGVQLTLRQMQRAAEQDAQGRRKLPFFVDPIERKLKIEKNDLISIYFKRQVEAQQLGHKSRDYRTTELYAAFDPAYLQNAVRAIDLLFEKLRASFAPVDEPLFRAVPRHRLEIDWKFGAGEGIRTPDPNLGKVVLYP